MAQLLLDPLVSGYGKEASGEVGCMMMSKKSSQPQLGERRNSPRSSAQIVVFAADGKSQTCSGSLGLSGCHCLLEESLPKGEKVRIALVLADHLALELKGRVSRVSRRAGKHATVILFDPLTFEKERSLARWLDSSLGSLSSKAQSLLANSNFANH